MPDFEFYPWERLSPQVTDGDADARAKVGRAEWLFRRCGDIWFARNALKKHDWNFVLRLFPGAISSTGMVAWEEPQPNTLALYVSNRWRGLYLGRVWKIEDTLATWSESQGWALFAGFDDFARSEQETPFRLELPSPTRQTPSSVVHSNLQSEWKNPDSDLSFSVRFAALPEEYQRLYGVETRLETPQKLAHLLRVALRAFAPHWPPELSEVTLELNATGVTGNFVLSEQIPFGIRQRAILNHIVRAFEPRQLSDSPSLPSAVRTLTKDNWTRSFAVSTTRPSMHDRMEALLELRGWLQDHWPEGVRHLGKVV